MASKIKNPNILFGEKRYLVRINGKVIGAVDTEHVAQITLERTATIETKKFEKPNTMVFRRDGKKEIRLYTQTSGIFQGAVHQKMIIDVIDVPRIDYSPYADKIAKYKAEKAKRE